MLTNRRTFPTLVSASTLLAAVGASTSALAAVPHGMTGSILATADNQYIGTGSGSLISSPNVPGGIERFQIVDLGNGNVALKSLSSSQYVCAENAGESALIANRAAAGPWETFTWIDLGHGEFGLQSAANGKYVTAENAGASALIANRTGIGAWETFRWVDSTQVNYGATGSILARADNQYVTSGSGNLISSSTVPGLLDRFQIVHLGNGKVALKSLSNNNYVSAENGGNSPLIANRGAVGVWETFTWIDRGNGDFALQAEANGQYVAAENGGAGALIANRSAIGPWETFHWVDANQAVCPGGLQIYGEWLGGFCCNGPLSANATTCNGSSACALDPTRTQGLPLCYQDNSLECRSVGSDHYYRGNVGGFCCDGTLSADKNSCSGSVCALDPTRTQGNPVCNVVYRGFTTNPAHGPVIEFLADPAEVTNTATGVSITGSIIVEGNDENSGIELANATIQIGIGSDGYVNTLMGTANVSLPNTGALTGLELDPLAQVVVGLDWGANLKNPANPQHVEAPMKDDRQYLVYSMTTGLGGTYGNIEFSANGGTSTLIVVDPRDPSFYFKGDLSGITGMSALDDVGVGMSVQGLFPFEHEYTWGIENSLQEFEGNLVLEGGIPLGRLPLDLGGQLMVRMPTMADPVTHIGINGELSVGVNFCPGVSFSVPIGEGSASAHLGQTADDAYFSGRVFANSGQILPANLPITLNGELKAAGRLSTNMNNSFLKLAGTATVNGYGLQQAMMQFDKNGVAVSGLALLPGFNINVAGQVGPGSASLSGTLNVSIPVRAPKEITTTANQTVYYTSNGAKCGWQTVTDASICGYDTVTNGAVCGYNTVTNAAVCGWTNVASWFCQTFGCAPVEASCQVAATCNVPKSCSIANSCALVEPYTSTYTEQNYQYGTYNGTVQVGINSGSGVSGSISGSYCPVGGVCGPPASARVQDLGGAGAKACVSVSPFGEFCVDL